MKIQVIRQKYIDSIIRTYTNLLLMQFYREESQHVLIVKAFAHHNN